MRSSDALVRTTPTDAAPMPPMADGVAAWATPAPLRIDRARAVGPRVSVVIVAAGDEGTSAEDAAELMAECARLSAQVVLVIDGSRRGSAIARGADVRHVVAPAGASAVEYRRLGAQHADGDVLLVADGDGRQMLERLQRLTFRRPRAD